MGKVADRYFEVDPWIVRENGFDPAYGAVSESVFSIGNEYVGMRGYFEEGYTGAGLMGCYINGVYERRFLPRTGFKGMLASAEYMTNTVDLLYTRIFCNGQPLDLAVSKFSDFTRSVDMRTGVLTRSFVWQVDENTAVRLCFERFTSMDKRELVGQKIEFQVIGGTAELTVKAGLDFSRIHVMSGANHWNCENSAVRTGAKNGFCQIGAKTEISEIDVVASAVFSGTFEAADFAADESEKQTAVLYCKRLSAGQSAVFCRLASVFSSTSCDVLEQKAAEAERTLSALDYDQEKKISAAWWENTWQMSDIEIDGDPDNQQGIRYCMFQMHQTLHSAGGAVIGAKGLTGEVYNGNTFWDTEVYCLPFYLFTNPKAAKGILNFRYNTLPQAMERAEQLGLKGAYYPVATISGREGNDLWQYANLQLQCSTAVVYGIWLYCKLMGDRAFLYEKGVEMLIEICRMLTVRGGYNQLTGQFGYYGVMGPDEFQMMVNNNAYTNFMAQKTFRFTLQTLCALKKNAKDKYERLFEKTSLKADEIAEWENIAENMYIPRDEATGIFEQNDGFFSLPHIDIDKIPQEEFPLYNNWSYESLYRNDVVKQPDVLMFMLLYNTEFSLKEIEANYDYYEPRCLHESSLSPSVHSILAAQLGRMDAACDFFSFATRMDLDNYNRNTRQGVHTTANAGAWMNVVFGFGGMRCDGDILSFSPCMPSGWKRYSFKIVYNETVITVDVQKDAVTFQTDGGECPCEIYGKPYTVGSAPLTIAKA